MKPTYCRLSFAIPSRLTPSSRQVVYTSLHGFSDASTVAYGVSIYVRSVLDDGSVSVTLVAGKARVLPVRPVTIPKAELLGAHLLAKMLSHTADVLSIPLADVYAWTDSEIVLYWLPKYPSSLDRFVANRVHTIQDLIPPSALRHVSSALNPADLASRGIRAPDLATSTLWWSGPPWLALPPDKWPTHKLSKPKEASQCLTISTSYAMNSEQSRFLDALWSKFSSYHTLVRVVARIRRFLRNSRSSTPVKIVNDSLLPEEISDSKALLFKLAQLQSYPDAFQAITKQKSLPKNHPFLRFIPSYTDAGHLALHTRVRDPFKPSSPRSLIPLHA